MLGTIVLADDSKTVRRMVEIALHKHAFQLEVATDGATALDLVRGRGPALVLVDTHLPGDGYLLAKQIKSLGAKVLLLAGHHQPLDADKAAASGADGHLTKPFLTQDLLDAVYQAVAGKSAPDAHLFRDAPSAIPLAKKPQPAPQPVAQPVPPPKQPTVATPAKPPAPPPVAATANPFSGVQSPFEQNEPTRPFFKGPELPPAGGFENAPTNVAPAPAAPVAPAAPATAAPVAAAAGVVLNDASLKKALEGISQEQIEKLLWEILPPLAEAILKEEIARVVRERMAAQ